MKRNSRLVIVSNRLPVTVDRDTSPHSLRPSNGGLATALSEVLRKRGGCWVGWTGCEQDPDVLGLLDREWRESYSLSPVELSPREIEQFYRGCSNEIIWPLFHDLQSRCHFDPDYWQAYRDINERFADHVQEVAGRDDFVWVHDYHLMLQAECLRARDVQLRVGYFHHIPFPPPDIFEKLPWRREILTALLAFHVVGFQTTRDRRNFTACVRRHLPDVRVRRIGAHYLVQTSAGTTTVSRFPIGIAFQGFRDVAESASARARAEQLRSSYAGCKIIVGVDRLDYTKGIPERLSALEYLLESRRDWVGRVVFLQVLVPSREEIPNYHELKNEIERRVGQINGRFGRPGWMPVHFLYRSLQREELVSVYRAGDVALVTPVKDGMNLVAKEYCATHTVTPGVLVLSEFAGAAEELGRGALTVNPYDVEGVADNIHRALVMNESEKCARMRMLSDIVRQHDVFRWCEQFCAAGSHRGFPRTDLSLPGNNSFASAM